MPDHFHGLIAIPKGDKSLGDAICAFKSRVVHEYIKRVKKGEWPRFAGKIWHRNYYEMIVRSQEAEENISRYIRMNPWKLVQHAAYEGQTFRMIGNPALLNREKIALLCSRNAPPDILDAAVWRARQVGANCCFVSGFHSPPEKNLLTALLASEARLVCCPAWGIDTLRIPPAWLPALENNRMLILEMTNRAGNLAAAEQRNRFVLKNSDQLWLPHITPGGMLDRLLRSTGDMHVAPTKGTP